MIKELKSFYFKDVKVTDIDLYGITELIDNILSKNTKGYFCLTEVSLVMTAQNDPNLMNAINRSTASIADGTPLAWFGKTIGLKNIKRVSGVDLFQQLIHHSNYKHFLLGDTDETQEKVIDKAYKINPNLQIACYSPPFKPYFNERDNKIIFDKINVFKPDLIWVGFGGGKQEKWMFQNINNLDRGIMLGVGAAFKFYIGNLLDIPKPMQRIGLQWTTRLIDDPKRWVAKGPLIHRVRFLLNLPIELVKSRRYVRLLQR